MSNTKVRLINASKYGWPGCVYCQRISDGKYARKGILGGYSWTNDFDPNPNSISRFGPYIDYSSYWTRKSELEVVEG